MGGRRPDESTKTRSESVAESYRIRRETETNAGIQPMRHAQVGQLVPLYVESFPPQTSAKHRHEVTDLRIDLLRLTMQIAEPKATRWAGTRDSRAALTKTG